MSLTIAGTHLQGAVVTTGNPDVILKPLPGSSSSSVTVEVTVPRLTTLGATTLTVTTPFGETSTTFTILDVLTTVIGRVVDDAGTPLSGAQVTILGGPTGATAADGTFQFTNLSAFQFESIQVSASALVNGVGLSGATAFVSPVLNGVTDVGTVTITSPHFDHQFGQPLQFDPFAATFVPFSQGFTFTFYGTHLCGSLCDPTWPVDF